MVVYVSIVSSSFIIVFMVYVLSSQAEIVVEDHDYCRVAAWRVAPSRRVAAAYGVAYVLCKWVFSSRVHTMQMRI